MERRALLEGRPGVQTRQGLARSAALNVYTVETAADRSPRLALPSTRRGEPQPVAPDWTGVARDSQVEDAFRIPQAAAATNMTVFGTVR